jgi:hypothetical protein
VQEDSRGRLSAVDIMKYIRNLCGYTSYHRGWRDGYRRGVDDTTAAGDEAAEARGYERGFLFGYRHGVTDLVEAMNVAASELLTPAKKTRTTNEPDLELAAAGP